jgi:uncharacterized protein (TIGR03086 family)
MISSDGLTALGRANVAFGQRLRLVEADDLTRPTPCTEWDVYALVNHVIGGNRRYVLLLQGATAEIVERTRTEDHLGTDPCSAFASTAQALDAAFREEGALSRTAHHPIGHRSGAELLAMRVLDVIVHAWDLARGLNVDDTLDSDAVEFALAHTEMLEAGRQRGTFRAPHPTLGAKALSPQARLLHLAGRSIEGDSP